eukprot:gb/GECH01008068.1/.p1 GENE.gb/GECH01008068.1/~~gb/GECH01008068.1/.p1  ORF type:complete len:137 (+),score=21.78 gb/GECH01008068.1/:1-411(+)
MIRSTTKSTLSTAAITKTDQHQQNYRKIYSTARSNYYNKIISHDSLKVPSSQFSQIQTFHKNINLVNNTQPCLSISVHRNYSSISTGWLKLQGNTNNLILLLLMMKEKNTKVFHLIFRDIKFITSLVGVLVPEVKT